jgi:hypothetical protein
MQYGSGRKILFIADPGTVSFYFCPETMQGIHKPMLFQHQDEDIIGKPADCFIGKVGIGSGQVDQEAAEAHFMQGGSEEILCLKPLIYRLAGGYHP